MDREASALHRLTETEARFVMLFRSLDEPAIETLLVLMEAQAKRVEPRDNVVRLASAVALR